MMIAQPPAVHVEASAPSYAQECAVGRTIADGAIASCKGGMGPLAFKATIAAISDMSEGRQAGFCARLAEEIAGR